LSHFEMTAAVALAALLVAGLLLTFRLRREIKFVHSRMRVFERFRSDLEAQVAIISRVCVQNMLRGNPEIAESKAQCNAQHGEELFLWNLCGFKQNGYFVEVGAYDGLSLSNSLFFEQIGWEGILIEAHPILAKRCQQNRPASTVVPVAIGNRDGGETEFAMVSGSEGMDTLSFVEADERHLRRIKSKSGMIDMVKVPMMTLRSILADLGVREIDWMSIDVEGSELAVLEGLGIDHNRPRILLIEENSEEPDEAINTYLGSNGYVRSLKLGCNVIFVDVRGKG